MLVLGLAMVPQQERLHCLESRRCDSKTRDGWGHRAGRGACNWVLRGLFFDQLVSQWPEAIPYVLLRYAFLVATYREVQEPAGSVTVLKQVSS